MPNISNEEWRPIPGLHNIYSVSNIGRVRSEPRTTFNKGSGVAYRLKGRILKPQADKSGHLQFGASIKGVVKMVQIHTAVMLAFIGPRPDGLETRHLDGDPANNCLENLRYGTRSENIADAKRHGTFPLLEERPGAILNRAQAREIVESREPVKVLAKRYGVTESAIGQVRCGSTWSSVTGDLLEARRANRPNRFTAEQVVDIFTSDSTAASLAERFGVRPQTIFSVWARRNYSEITRDLPSRLRSQRGERSTSSSLTRDQVVDILRRGAGGESRRALSEEFHVSHTTISSILNDKTWKHVDRAEFASLDPTSV